VAAKNDVKPIEEVTVMINVQNGMPLIESWAHDSVSNAHIRLKNLAAKFGDDEVKLSYWQLIFLQSKVNGCAYNIDELSQVNWQWPKNTWFQERLSHYLLTLETSLEVAADQRLLRQAAMLRRIAPDLHSPQ
jgi:hypothetical protein